jgi:hypothetical protein
VDSPNERRPGGTRIERSRPQKLLGLRPSTDHEREGRHECFGDNVETNRELSELTK